METNPILYVILNKELNMSAGKAAAQTAHAVAMLGNFNNAFIDFNKRTVIVLEAENEAQIRNLNEYLFNEGLSSYYYIDEGFNEVGPYSVTAMAVEPIAAGDEERRQIFAPFNLYGGLAEDPRKAALDSLFVLSREFRSYDFMDTIDYTPRPIRKAIKWLRRNQK